MSEENVALEIGPGSDPLINMLRPDLKTGKKIYIERSERGISTLKELSDTKGKVIKADISNTPLSKNSITSVFMSNVFGFHGQPETATAAWTQGEIANIGDFDKILSELKRICKNNATITILETSTPYNQIKLINLFENAGFKVIEKHNKKNVSKIFDKENFESQHLGDVISQNSVDNSYAIVFKREYD